MSKSTNRAHGDIGERLAQKFLRQKGYQILETNLHLGKYSELDIVATYEGQLHIIEVKTRIDCGYPEDNVTFPVYNVTKRKLQHLMRGARMYLQRNQSLDMDVVIDVVGVVWCPARKKAWIQLFPNITEGCD